MLILLNRNPKLNIWTQTQIRRNYDKSYTSKQKDKFGTKIYLAIKHQLHKKLFKWLLSSVTSTNITRPCLLTFQRHRKYTSD